MTEITKHTSTPNQQLRHERERRCWSQQELADKVGTTPLNVSRWERGLTFPNPYFRQKLCEVFEKSAQQLGLIPENAFEQKPSRAEPPANLPNASPPPEAQTSLWNVPYRRNPLFTGREEILTFLRSALTTEEQPIALSQPQAISGLGGIGKTQIAVEYAHRYRDSYSAVLWARADSSDLLVSDFLTIASLLNLPERNEQDQNIVVKAVMRWFDTHEGWLLILDNADNLEIASEFIPSAGKGHVLLTTRAHSTGTIAQRIELDKMALNEGTLFLLRRAKHLKGATSLEKVPSMIRSQAQAIVEAVDSLPLALDQAGAYIEETGCSLADYLKFYKNRRTRLLRTRGRDATGHPEPVATTWSLSFEKVERANPAAAELLRLCAFLHPDEIPEAMIVEGASELGPILQPVAEDELDFNEAIGELLKYSLVKRDPEAKILNIHRLVQAVLKDAMDNETQRIWTERAVHMVNRVFPKVEFTLWSTCQQYLPHAQICAGLIQQWEMKFQEAARLLHEVGYYLKERAQYAEAETIFQRALTIREEVLGLNHPDVAKSLNNLAALCYQLGKYEQIKVLSLRALAIQEEKLGLTHPDVAESLNNLGVFYSTQGDNEQAILFLQRALTIREQVLGDQHLDTASNLIELAALYRDQREYEQAEPLFKDALTIHEQVLGPEHPQVAIALNHFAGLYNEQAKYEQAEPLFKRALVINEKTLGPEHPQVALNLNNLAMIYYSQGKYEQAEQLLLRTLSIHERMLGPEHPDTARTFKNLAKLYTAEGKYGQAESLYMRSLGIREKALGPMHPLVALTLKDYAILLRKTGRETEAAALEARAQTIRAEQE